MVLLHSSNKIFQKCLTRGVVTTEDIDEELASQEPLLLVPEDLSMTTTLAKRKLAPLLKKAGLPSLEVQRRCEMRSIPLYPVMLIHCFGLVLMT